MHVSNESNALCVSSTISIFLKIFGFYIERAFMNGEEVEGERERKLEETSRKIKTGV